MFNSNDYSYLQQVIDTTWGQSSTDMSPTMVVKMRILDDTRALVTYTTVITYHNVLRQDTVEAERKIAEETIDAYIKGIKKSFNELAEHAIKMKLTELDVNVEDIDMSAHSPRRTAYFRCFGIVELS